MKSLLCIGGPLLVFTAVAFWTDFFTLPSEEPGIVHFSGVPLGGLFQLNTKTYVCDESGGNCELVKETTETTELTEVEGLEFENQPIEYRNGSEDITITKQPGIAKYTNIHLKRMSDFTFDVDQWKFENIRQRQDGAFFLDEEDASASEALFEDLDRSPSLPGPKNSEAAMETVELEVEELEVE